MALAFPAKLPTMMIEGRSTPFLRSPSLTMMGRNVCKGWSIEIWGLNHKVEVQDAVMQEHPALLLLHHRCINPVPVLTCVTM